MVHDNVNDQVMHDVETVQESCSDIPADAKAINEAKAAKAEIAYIEDGAKSVHVLSANSRRINREYKEKMVFQVLRHYAKRLLLPMPVRKVINTVITVPRIWLAVRTLIRRQLNVEVLDGSMDCLTPLLTEIKI